MHFACVRGSSAGCETERREPLQKLCDLGIFQKKGQEIHDEIKSASRRGVYGINSFKRGQDFFGFSFFFKYSFDVIWAVKWILELLHIRSGVKKKTH